jgi:Flp pilus assembly protein TadG
MKPGTGGRLVKMRRMITNSTDERGLSIVMVALMMVALLSVAAVVIDLGQAYANRRQMQNSADAAALAATRALDKARSAGFANSALNNAVDTTASSVATSNGARGSLVTCQVVRWNYYLDSSQVIAPCSPTSGWTGDATNGGPAGVVVKTGTTANTAFGSFVGASTTTARATAASTIQPLATGKGPFIICGNGSDDGYDILNADGTFNAAKATALGVFPIQAAQLPRCNGPAAFKGKAADVNAVFTIPGTDVGTNGNGFDSTIQGIVLGATPCPNDGSSDCDLVLPIADSTNGYNFHITAVAVFHVTGDGHGNPKYFAQYLGNLTTAGGGQGGTGVCPVGGLCVIKLVT